MGGIRDRFPISKEDVKEEPHTSKEKLIISTPSKAALVVRRRREEGGKRILTPRETRKTSNVERRRRRVLRGEGFVMVTIDAEEESMTVIIEGRRHMVTDKNMNSSF